MLGRSLLHYTISEKIGEGGMGIVYKARDTHLDRFVALKSLPPDRVDNEERKRRFIQEAKAASALNHPNIINIYDIATDQDTTFIAMEFVQGKTLSDVIPRQGLTVGRVLNYAVQIADGAAAHQAGIIHRDLKPGNIMIGEDGRVRILDFGLAKLMDQSISSEDAATRTVTRETAPDTDEGMIVGTVAYMSPEQAEGRKVDTRTDIFSFGVLLYEMLSGRRPFSGESRLATMSAILKEAPKPLSEVVPGIPAELERLVDRCLRKDPDRRWQNMADVRIALLDLKEESDSGRLTASAPRIAVQSAKSRWIYAAVVLIVVAAAGGWLLLRSPQPEQTAQNFQPVPLTSYEGDERDPAFSPDGNQIAFSWGPEGGVTNTYLKLVGPGDPVRLTNSPFMERMSQWSPDGKWIAFQTNCNGGTAIVAVPALGGPERVVSTSNWRLYWTPDSKFLILPDGDSLYLAPLGGGERKLLLGPLELNGVKYRVGTGAVSSDGHTLAVSYRVGNRMPLYFVPLGDGYTVQGQPRRVTPEDWSVPSWSWTPDSKTVIAIRDISDANLGGDTGMYRIAVSGGEPQRLGFAGDNPWFLDVARSGNRLAYTRLRRDVNLYRAELAPDGTLRGTGSPIASSSRREYQPAYSPDGSRITFASNRSGSDEIWVGDRNGGNLVQLTNSANPDGTAMPQWSPDGNKIVYVARPAGALATDIFVISAAGGAPQQLTSNPVIDRAPLWSRDGNWIYFISGRIGETGLWKVAAAGGEATQVGRFTFSAITSPAIESPDGKWIYVADAGAVSRVAASASDQPQRLVQDRIDVSTFQVTDRGIYYLSPAQDLKSATLRFVGLDGGTPKTLGTISGTIANGLSVSPDHSSILYSQCDQCAADIMLVENFK